jgi:membrane protein DedA with SNARE-associated domain
MKKTRKAEENAKRLRSFLTSPVRLSAVFIVLVGIFVYLIYVLGQHPFVPLPLQNRLLVAILNGAIAYCLGLFGAWIAMKSWESKAKKGR